MQRMKKLLAFMVALVTVILVNMPFSATAEAANVAVVPIDNDVGDDAVGRLPD